MAHDIDTIALEAAERIMQISFQPMLGGAPQLKAKIQCEVRAALDVLAVEKTAAPASSGDDLLDRLQRAIDEAERKPSAKLARALEQAREIRERFDREPSTQKAPCTDCGACVGGPHGCGKPGLHGKAEPDEDGWIEWKGGECPVTEGTLVDVWHFDGEVVCEASALEFGAAYDWSHTTPHKAGDIIAYRLHRPATPRRDATQN